MTPDWAEKLLRPADVPNPHLGTRFDSAGRFLRETGNTLICQVIPGSPTEAALIDLRAELLALPCADCFAFTAIRSYHMTLFEGVIETRRMPGFWPADLPLDTPIDRMTDRLAARLADFAPPPAFAIRPVQVTPFGLRLAGASAADDAVARAWRDALSAALGWRTPSHLQYGFHTTLAYVIDRLPEPALPGYIEAMERLTQAFCARIQTLDLARPALCRFDDMNAFPPVLPL